MCAENEEVPPRASGAGASADGAIAGGATSPPASLPIGAPVALPRLPGPGVSPAPAAASRSSARLLNGSMFAGKSQYPFAADSIRGIIAC
jgi:hypothetical protein